MATLYRCLLPLLVLLVATGCRHPLRAANKNVPVVLPDDHAAHEDAQTEWWHFHGHMSDEQGRRYDWFLAFIKQHTDHDKVLFVPMHWFVDPFHVAYFAITERSTGSYHLRELHSYPDVWAASASRDRLSLRHNSWRVDREEDGSMKLEAGTLKSRAELILRNLKPAALMGDNGYYSFPPRSSHYYYSMPRMAAEGTITIDGDKRKVRGLAWFKHEWGFLYTKDMAGWVWFGVQLSSGHDLEIALVFDHDWNMVKGSFARIEEEDGTVTAIDLPKLQVKELGDVWRSPETGAVYPMDWLLEIPGRGSLRIASPPKAKAQEMVVFPANLWAGGMTVEGRFDGQRVWGDCFTEIVGIDKPFGRAFFQSGRPKNAREIEPRSKK